MFAINGILFNHEGPTRGENFVTRKITIGVAQILAGKLDMLQLGNLDAKRDWGHAKDYVEGMWLMMQQEIPEDYVLATGITTSVRDFVRLCFEFAGIELSFSGTGIDEIAVVRKCNNPAYLLPEGTPVLTIHPRYFRPAEVDILQGDATKAKTKLGWQPKYTLEMLVNEMMANEIIFQSKRT
jgi:GDPmannose 4,6-dehydratase